MRWIRGLAARALAPATLLALLAGAARPAAAQLSGSIPVNATVQTGLQVTPQYDLRFMVVMPGVPATVDASDTYAGEFGLYYLSGAKVNVTFTLPATLANGGNTLPIGSWTGLYNTSDTPTGGTSFVPSSQMQRVVLGTAGTGYVFVGATVTPAAGQPVGVYTATIVLSAHFVGF